MSAEGQLIVCRRCNETVSLGEGSCPHCGTSIRGNAPYLGGIALGVVLFGTSLLNLGELLAFSILGLLIAATAGYLFHNKRRRIKQASERSTSSP